MSKSHDGYRSANMRGTSISQPGNLAKTNRLMRGGKAIHIPTVIDNTYPTPIIPCQHPTTTQSPPPQLPRPNGPSASRSHVQRKVAKNGYKCIAQACHKKTKMRRPFFSYMSILFNIPYYHPFFQHRTGDMPSATHKIAICTIKPDQSRNKTSFRHPHSLSQLPMPKSHQTPLLRIE